jgi:hypothetical protein
MITEINPFPALESLLNLLRHRVEAGATADEFNLITRAIELINERRPIFKDEEQSVYYIGADEPSRAPYRVTLNSCTCPRGNERTCKHRLLIAALENKTINTEGFEYTRRKKVVKQEDVLQFA